MLAQEEALMRREDYQLVARSEETTELETRRGTLRSRAKVKRSPESQRRPLLLAANGDSVVAA